MVSAIAFADPRSCVFKSLTSSFLLLLHHQHCFADAHLHRHSSTYNIFADAHIVTQYGLSHNPHHFNPRTTFVSFTVTTLACPRYTLVTVTISLTSHDNTRPYATDTLHQKTRYVVDIFKPSLPHSNPHRFPIQTPSLPQLNLRSSIVRVSRAPERIVRLPPEHRQYPTQHPIPQLLALRARYQEFAR